MTDNTFALTVAEACPDVRQAGWTAWPEGDPGAAMPFALGERWECSGHAGWNRGSVVHRLVFTAPEELRGRHIGFFCTAADDEVEVRINGVTAGRQAYRWGYQIPGPVIVDLSPWIRHGAGANELLLIVRDHASVRGGGIVGNVCLSHGLPAVLGPEGQLRLPPRSAGRFQVLLHLGAARLVRHGQDAFTASELAGLAVPAGILRPEELVLVVPEGSVDATRLLVVDLAHVHPVHSRQGLSLVVGGIPAEVPCHQRLALAIDLAATYDNPDDPEDVSLSCLVTTPSGRIEQVPGFFAQDFASHAVGDEEEILLPAPGRPWKLYYRPREPGGHRLEVLACDRSGTVRVDGISFTCIPSADRGFLRISPENPRQFRFDDGTPFFATGPSGWFRSRHYLFGGNPRWVSTRALAAYFARKREAGCTYEYLGTFHFGAMLLPGGRIDPHVGWKLEQALRAMEACGLQWLQFSDDLRRTIQAQGVEALPYWHTNGGPARCLEDLYAQPQALRLQERRLRHLVARCADSPALWIWNCGDEAQPGVAISPALVRQWIRHLHGCIRRLDVYGHAHALGEGRDGLRDGGEVLLLPDWYYGSDDLGDPHEPRRLHGTDDVAVNVAILQPFMDLDVPVINTEGGICQWNHSADISGETILMDEEVPFHCHLWISLLLNCAAGGTDWLCNLIDRRGQLHHARALQAFIAGEPLANQRWASATVAEADPRLRGLTLRSADGARILLWLADRSYTWHAVAHGRLPAPVVQATVALEVPPGSRWRIAWWDTRRGQEVASDEMAADAAGRIRLSPPAFARDLAAKALRLTG